MAKVIFGYSIRRRNSSRIWFFVCLALFMKLKVWKNIEPHRDVAKQNFKNFDRMLFKSIIVSSNVSGGMKVLQKKNLHFILTWSCTISPTESIRTLWCRSFLTILFFYSLNSAQQKLTRFWVLCISSAFMFIVHPIKYWNFSHLLFKE